MFAIVPVQSPIAFDETAFGRLVTDQLNHVHNVTIQRFADSCQRIHADIQDSC